MNNTDNKIQELGFTLVKYDDKIGFWLYENIKDDQRVEINFDGDDWYIHSKTISTLKNFMGDRYHECLALRYDEMKVFMNKIEELKTYYESKGE